MIIDCDGCGARGPVCQDCVVTVLLGMPGGSGDHGHPAAGQREGRAAPVLVSGPALAVRLSTAVELDAAERAAIAVLAGSGLVPPLRMVPIAGAADDAPPPVGERTPGARRGRGDAAVGVDAGEGSAGPPGAGVADPRPA